MVLMAVIPDIIACDGSEVRLWLSCCRASHTTGNLLPLPKADGVGMLLLLTMVCHKLCDMLAQSTLMTPTIKKCLHSDLTIRLSYCSFCKFGLWNSQRHCGADGKLGMLRHCWVCSCSPFQAECKADQQWDIEYSARPLVQGSAVPLHLLRGGSSQCPFFTQAHEGGVYIGAFQEWARWNIRCSEVHV